MIVSFWSPVEGNRSVEHLVLTSCQYSIMGQDGEKTLIFNTHKQLTMLDHAFSDVRGAGGRVDASEGMAAIENFIEAGLLTPTNLLTSTEFVFINKLDRVSMRSSFAAGQDKIFKNILNVAESAYDTVMVDIGSGSLGELELLTLEKSTVLVITIPQSTFFIEKYRAEIEEIAKGRNVIYCIEDFDRTSNVTLVKLAKALGTKLSNLTAISRLRESSQAFDQGNVLELFLRKSPPKRIFSFDEYLNFRKELSVIVSKLRKYKKARKTG